MRKGMSVQKKCLKKNKYFKNKFLAKNVFINGDIGGMGKIIVIWGGTSSAPYNKNECSFLLERKIIY